MIFVDKKKRRQNEAHKPIIFPPNKTSFCGKNNEGMNRIEIIIIPKKKKKENKKFLIILIKSYIKSASFCLFFIMLILDPLMSISAGLGLRL